MSNADINYNANDTLKKLVEDEGWSGLLKRLGGFLIASNACFFLVIFLVLCTSHIPSWVLTILCAVAVFPLVLRNLEANGGDFFSGSIRASHCAELMASIGGRLTSSFVVGPRFLLAVRLFRLWSK